MPFSDFDRAGEVWQAYVREGVQVVYILAGEQEVRERTGIDLRQFYEGRGLRVVTVPVPDFGLPLDPAAFGSAASAAASDAAQGRSVAIHCYAGVGRTGMFVALMARRLLKADGTDAIAWTRRWIPGACETSAQQAFVTEFPAEAT
jgi:protein-tyrosine phosphatase